MSAKDKFLQYLLDNTDTFKWVKTDNGYETSITGDVLHCYTISVCQHKTGKRITVALDTDATEYNYYEDDYPSVITVFDKVTKVYHNNREASFFCTLNNFVFKK